MKCERCGNPVDEGQALCETCAGLAHPAGSERTEEFTPHGEGWPAGAGRIPADGAPRASGWRAKPALGFVLGLLLASLALSSVAVWEEERWLNDLDILGLLGIVLAIVALVLADRSRLPGRYHAVGYAAIVVGIWGAVLARPFASAGENARGSTCEIQEKQIALACIAYEQDYDEHFPPIGDGKIGSPSTGSWERRINPYLKGAPVWHCPDGPPGQSYAANGFASGSPRVGVFGYSVEVIRDPVNTFLLVEDFTPGATPPGPAEGVSLQSVGHNDWTPGAHSLKSVSNYAFCDGHVKSMLSERYTDAYSAEVPRERRACDAVDGKPYWAADQE